MDRGDILRRGLNKRSQGLEIGPFYSPIVAKRDGWDTIVVDTAPTEVVRDTALKHPASSIRENAWKVEDVDVVWTGVPLDVACSALAREGLGYIVASHVIEHVPDFVSFLQQCTSLLGDDGVISLAVPDMRRCFDALKPPTATRDVLAAYRERRTRHTPETLFSARAWGVSRGDAAAWVQKDASKLRFNQPFAPAVRSYFEDAEVIGERPYVDAHAWHFTPSSFRLILLELTAMNLIDLELTDYTPSVGAEFFVQLRRGVTYLDDKELQDRRVELAVRTYSEILSELPELNNLKEEQR